MRKKDFILLIEKFLNHQTDVEENKLLFFFLNQFQSKKEWDEEEMGSKEETHDQIYNQLLLSTVLKDQKNQDLNSKTRLYKSLIFKIASIASIAILIFITFFSSNIEYTTITTGIRESKKIKLPDGTTIWLGAQSIIKYPNSFSKVNRNIQFNGVGFFEVTHDSLHPFTIKGNDFQTIVKGTSFNLKTNDSTAEVVLLNGKVEILASDKSLILHPNEKANFVKKSHQLLNKKDQNALNYSHRKEGLFIYKGELLGDALNELENYFGIKILRSSIVNDYHFFGEFKDSQSVDEILKLISISINGDYKLLKTKTYNLKILN